jgi:hypothetical protein
MTLNPLQFHHLYIGLILLVVGATQVHDRPWLAWLMLIAGLILTIDDINQHWGNGASPINRAFQWCWKKAWGSRADEIWQMLFGNL